MGKATGFLEYERKNAAVEEPLKRIRHFNEFRTPLPLEEQQKQGARCMECGVPFCQNGAMLAGMASGCRCIIWYRRRMIWYTVATGNRHMRDSRRHTVFRNLPAVSALHSARQPVPVI